MPGLKPWRKKSESGRKKRFTEGDVKMFKVGDAVRYRKEWSSPAERDFIHAVKEIRLNPVTMEETRYLIQNMSVTRLGGIHPVEVVDEEMIELVEV